MRGFYLSMDITLATGIALAILVVLLLTFANLSGSDAINLASYKQGESALYTMKHDGTLSAAVAMEDAGNATGARALVLSELSNYGLPMNALLNIREYDGSMGAAGSFSVQTGPVGQRAYAMAIPFKPNSTAGKYAIATLVVGK